MGLLEKITIKNIKLNRKRTIVTIIGTILSVALIMAVATMYSSCITSLIEFEKQEKGDFHVAFYNVPKQEINDLKNNRKIEDVFITKNVGYAKLENSKNEDKPYAFVKAFTKDSLEHLSINLVEGRLPTSQDEIVIPTHLETNGRVSFHVSDTLTLNVGTRVSGEQELGQEDEFSKENEEEIIHTTTKTYKIVGIVERPATSIESYSAPGYTFITFMDEQDASEKIDAYCKFSKEGSKDYIKVTANILGIKEKSLKTLEEGQFESEEEFAAAVKETSNAKYTYEINSYLIDLENNPLNNNVVGDLEKVVAVVCGIIVFTSVFCIKNSFDISIAEKTKQYGMLKSIGATKKQIRRNVFFEASVLGIIGIPLGILLGIIASWILVIISNYFLGDMLMQELQLILSISWKACAVAITLGVVTIYLSAFQSARRATKISPIQSIRNSGDIKIKSKKIKCPVIIKKVCGVGGEISYKNLKRNKKKYGTTVISIVVSVFVFIALSYFMSLAFETLNNEVKLQKYNVTLVANDKNDEEIYTKILETTKLENIKKCVIQKSNSCYIVNPKYNSQYREFLGDVNYEEEFFEGFVTVQTLNDEQYKEYIKQLGVDYEKIKDKAILVDKRNVTKYDEEKSQYIEKKMKVFEYEEKDKIQCKTIQDKMFEIEIGMSTDILPEGNEGLQGCCIILSNETFDTYFTPDVITVYYDSNNPNELQNNIDEILSGENYNIMNMAESANMMKKLYTLIGIFLYGFIIVIIAIGITNIFNTITTSMELRKPEFAMLKSIGMTQKEFKRMIRLETIFMGVKSLIFGVPIGIGLSYLIYNNLDSNHTTVFHLPTHAIIMAIVAVFLLITCIMKYAMGKINKQNTIETIRNENI